MLEYYHASASVGESDVGLAHAPVLGAGEVVFLHAAKLLQMGVDALAEDAVAIAVDDREGGQRVDEAGLDLVVDGLDRRLQPHTPHIQREGGCGSARCEGGDAGLPFDRRQLDVLRPQVELHAVDRDLVAPLAKDTEYRATAVEGAAKHFLTDLDIARRIADTVDACPGIPVLEALSSGVPVIAATGSCLEEAGGKDSIYIDPDDATGMADAVNRLLNNPGQRQKMAEQGKRHAALFSEERQAQQLMDLYNSLLSDKK